MNFQRSYSWVYMLAAVGYVWLAWNFFNTQASCETVCLFKNVSGLACPSCGSSRAILALLHGDIAKAILINPLGIVGALLLILLPLAWITGKLTRRDIVTRFFSIAEKTIRQPKAAIPLVALLVANWIWNIAKGL